MVYNSNILHREIVMKSAVLNTTQLAFLEELMLRFGKVVTYAQIAPLVPAADAVAKRQFVSRLTNSGWLVRIKKGVYQVADISSLGTLGSVPHLP